MLRSRFVIGLLAALIVSFTPIVSSVNAKSIVLNKTRITDFFKGVSIELNRPIVVSNKAGLFEISGEIDLSNPYAAIDEITNKTNLIWYDDASAIYVYSSGELRTDFIRVNTKEDFDQIIKFLRLSNLYSDAYPPRYTKGAAFVSGPPKYVDVIKDAVAAYYNGLASDEKPAIPLPIDVIKVFPLKNRFVTDMRYYIRGTEKTVDGALTILKRLIDERNDEIKNISIVADTLNNALYVKGTDKEVKILEELIEEIDIIREQIQLSLWIIDVDSSELKEVGTTLEGSFNTDIFSIGLNGGSVILNQNETLSFVGAVNSLETQKKARVLSRPVLITQNNTPAVIDTNETIYVRLVGNEEVSLEEITYGTILSVTPRVVKSVKGNDIEMMVEIEDGNQTADLIDGLPNIRRSVISTMGRITDSQSLLLGGFVRKQVNNQTRGIPILKNIPVIKYLFSMDVENTSSIMRLFMIEPKIIKDPVAEFNRSRIMGMQSETFIKTDNERGEMNNQNILIDPMTGQESIQNNNNRPSNNQMQDSSSINSPKQKPTKAQKNVSRQNEALNENPNSFKQETIQPEVDKRLNIRRLPQGNKSIQNYQPRGEDIIDRSRLNVMQPNVKMNRRAKIEQQKRRMNNKKMRRQPYVMVNPEEIKSLTSENE